MRKLALAISIFAFGCDRGAGPEKRPPSPPKKTVHLFIWAEYISQDVLKDFETKTGIHVEEANYPSDEEGLGMLKKPGSHYDLMVISNELLPTMIRENLVSPVEVANLKHLDPRFDRPSYAAAHDKDGKRVAVPYMWGTIGICYNSDKVKLDDPSWNALWDEKYKGKMCMFDQMLQTLMVGLKVRGHAVNDKDPKSLADAKDALLKQKPLLYGYVNDEYKKLLQTEDIWLSMAWNGDAAKEAKTKPALKYVVPKEGSTMWVDNLVLLSKPCDREAALAFLDYIMEPEVNAKISEGIYYASCNASAKKHLSKALAADKAIYPDEETLKRCAFREDPGDDVKKFREIWDAVKGN